MKEGTGLLKVSSRLGCKGLVAYLSILHCFSSKRNRDEDGQMPAKGKSGRFATGRIPKKPSGRPECSSITGLFC
jgi:hypothetical protein